MPTPIIPEKVFSERKDQNSFCVFFFGTHNFGWVVQSQVYSYQEGDAAFKRENEKEKLKIAIDEAEQSYLEQRELQNKKKANINQILKPKPYKRIKNNKILAKFASLDDSEKENVCGCKATDSSPCGVESDCVNQHLLIECDPKLCKAGDKCNNQCFRNGPVFAFEVRLTDSRGFGLFAKEQIPLNAFIIEYVGEVIDSTEFNLRFQRSKSNKEDNFYFLTMGNNFYIDAGPCGNDARFINHSCEPNSATKKWNVKGQTRIGFFAERNILPVSIRKSPIRKC